MNNKIIAKNGIKEEFMKLKENQKIYIIILSSKNKDRSFINDLKVIKIFRFHSLVYNIKLRETKRSLRKFEENQRIFITINGAEGSEVSYMNTDFLIEISL